MASWEAVEWAMRQDLQPATKLVLVAIARRANADNEAWPSQTTLARECGVSVSAVKRHLHLLMGAGLLSRNVRRREHLRNDPNLYRLVVESDAPLPSANGRVVGVNDDPHPVHRRPPLPSTNGPHSRSPAGGYSRSPVDPEPVTPEPARRTSPAPAPPARARDGWAEFRERLGGLPGLELDGDGEELLAAAAGLHPLLDLRSEAVSIAAYAKTRPRDETWSVDRVRRWLERSERERKEANGTHRDDPGGGDAPAARGGRRGRAGPLGAGQYAAYSRPSDAAG